MDRHALMNCIEQDDGGYFQTRVEDEATPFDNDDEMNMTPMPGQTPAYGTIAPGGTSVYTPNIIGAMTPSHPMSPGYGSSTPV
jgi:hypothetical protein